MKNRNVYRKSSIDRISSPDQLNDYLRVTNPTVWVLLAAIVLLLAGMLVWASFTYIGSFAKGSAKVENGVMKITFTDEEIARNVETGMQVRAGDVSSTVRQIGRNADGAIEAAADTSLPDGEYEVTVNYKKTQILKLLFN